MSRMPWATYLWPGLAQLWHRGFVAGLLLAAGFAILLNLLLLASFVWVELLAVWHLRWGWLALGTIWSVSAAVSAWYGAGEPTAGEAASAEGLFRDALNEYLQRSYFEAERILGRLLRRYPRDVEARLLLATVLRSTRRYDEALRELARLELFVDAEKWSLEIAGERRLNAEGQAGGTGGLGPADDAALAVALPRQAA